MDNNKVKQAGVMTRNADLDIVVIGEHSLRSNRYKKNFGENCDCSDINQLGLKEKLNESIIKTGKPTIIVLITGLQLGIE